MDKEKNKASSSMQCHKILPTPVQITNIDTTSAITSTSISPNTKHLFISSQNYPRISPIVGTEKALDDNKLVDVISDETQNSQVVRSGVRKRRKGKLLVLDLNGILADIMCVVPKGYKPDKKLGGNSVFKRPFCDDFLSFCFDNFDVGVWSSKSKKNVNILVDFLMGDMRHHLLFCWDNSYCTKTGFKTVENRHKPLVLKELKKLWDREDAILPWEVGEYNETNTLLLDDSPYKALHNPNQSHCTDTGYSTVENSSKPLVLKELKKLWDKEDPALPWKKGEYNESNTLLLDDSPYKALRNPPHTAVFPKSYSFEDKEDNSLGPGGDIRCYLQGLAMAENVQKYIKQHPFGQSGINTSEGFYSKVACAENVQISYS